MNRTMVKIYTAAGVMLLLGIIWGCGTGEYEQRLNKRINSLKTGSKFNTLSPPIEVPGTQVSIRIPQDFKNPPLKEGAMVDGEAVEPRRVKPNEIDITDLKATFEGFIEDANKGKQPYYLYIGVSSGPGRVNNSQILQAFVSQKFDNITQPADYQAQTPEGRSIDWKQCRATGNQEFYYVQPNGQGQFRQMPGTIEMLFHDENDTLVTLVWRMPTGIEQSMDLKSWITTVAGCVKVK